jgi:hypothetical protein
MKAIRLIFPSLLLMFSFSAFAQFKDKNNAFDEPGAGDPMREYTVKVPAGVTFTNAQGETVTGGKGITVPGRYISLMSSADAEKALASAMPFNMKSYTETEKQGMVVISLRVPEGAKLSYTDGRVVNGGEEIMLVVDAGSMKKSDTMTKEPTLFRSIGEM